MNKNNNTPVKQSPIMEWVWLFVSFLSFIAGIHAVTHHMAKQGLIFFIMFVISLAIFYLRRQLRIRQKDKDL